MSPAAVHMPAAASTPPAEPKTGTRVTSLVQSESRLSKSLGPLLCLQVGHATYVEQVVPTKVCTGFQSNFRSLSSNLQSVGRGKTRRGEVALVLTNGMYDVPLLKFVHVVVGARRLLKGCALAG